jgi:peptide/nickel transport system permease protein
MTGGGASTPVVRRLGAVILAGAAAGALGAPLVSPHSSDQRFPNLLNAPPTAVRVRDAAGGWRPPFIYAWRRISQLEQRYEEDRGAPVPLTWFAGGRLVSSSDDSRAPLLLLGADSFGRDVFARLLFGARLSLTLAFLSAIGATIIGGFLGAVAGYVGGVVDELMMRASDFVLVLPAMYVALVLRSMLPLTLEAPAVFALLTLIFAVVGSPFIARGVRAIVRTERGLDYAAAAASLGAGHARVLGRHLLPAARGFLFVEITMLVPAFIVAEATLSFVGLGFPDTMASWGTMLQDAARISAFADFPWLLSPAAAMFLVVWGLNLTLQGRSDSPQYERPM